jgi:predicted anti-sigma-YlaC factor YlaD
VLVVSPKGEFFEIECDEVRSALTDYLEDDLTDEMRRRIEEHLRGCRRCTPVYDGMRNVMQLLGDERAIELPKGFSQRLYRRLLQ